MLDNAEIHWGDETGISKRDQVGRGYAPKGKPLSETDKIFNKKVSKIRVRMEHVFGRMKQMGMDYVQSIGIQRASHHNSMSNLVYNIDRYAFLKGAAAK